MRPYFSTFASLLTLPLLLGSTCLQGGTWSDESVAGMNVQLYRPSTAPQVEGKRALMISLHGCIQKARDLRQGGNWERAADDHGMIVALPDAPNGGVIMGCWDYYGPDHTRTSRHDSYLIALVQTLLSRSDLNIDPRQVYLTGISSGGGETMVMGCLAPDLFAGFGVVAGPSVGTSSSGFSTITTSKDQVVSLCRELAGDAQGEFATQLASFLHGTTDYVVAQAYGGLNGEALAETYGASGSQASTSIAGGGRESLWADAKGPRISLVTVEGLGHAWPAGAGPGGPYIDAAHIDYPSYITEFFFRNNRRLGTATGPSANVQVRVKDKRLLVSGQADGAGHPVTKVELTVVPTGGGETVESATLQTDEKGHFQWESKDLREGTYLVTILVAAGGTQSKPVSAEGTVGVAVASATATLTGHIQAGRLTYLDFPTYYMKYHDQPFILYRQKDGRWSDQRPE